MGDVPFFDLLREWATEPNRRDGTVTTQEFIALASSWAGESLDDFLWPYLTETVLPQIEFDYEIAQGNAGADTKLSVILRQNQTSLFDNVFPLVVTTAAGITTERIPLNTRSFAVDLEFPAAVTKVELDPEQWVIWNEYAPGTSPQGLARIYPNPSPGGYVVFGYDLVQPARVEVRVMDTMGRQVFHDDLGTVYPDENGNEYGWDVRTVGGARVPSGVYWAALEIDGQRFVSKFSVVR
jgi:hypothetical protein